MSWTRDDVIRHCAVCAATGNRMGMSYSNLRNLDLRNLDLRGSDLRNLDLRGSNLRGSNLTGTDLRGSDLRNLDLTGTDLRGSNLRGSDLTGTDLRGSNLRGSDLRGSNLRGSDLRGSDLRGSNLSYSNLREADLTWATGIVCLNVGDPRGYRPVAVDHGSHWMIASGCRWMTAAEALAHWCAADYHTPALGQAYCRAIRELPEPGQ